MVSGAGCRVYGSGWMIQGVAFSMYGVSGCVSGGCIVQDEWFTAAAAISKMSGVECRINAHRLSYHSTLGVRLIDLCITQV